MGERILSLDEIRSIPAQYYPLMVFSDSVRSFFSLGVKIRTKGSYGHFMWLIGPDELASQWFIFRRFKVDHYRNSILKLVHNPQWSPAGKAVLLTAIQKDLAKPWIKTRYDALAILGQLVGLKWIQTPWLKICSDYASYLGLVDSEYDLKYPSPVDVNQWTKEHNPPYEVYGRYMPD